MALSLVVSVVAALLAAVPARATTAGGSTSTGSGRAVLVQLTSSVLGNATIDDTGTVTVPGNVDRPLANLSGVVSGSVADAQVNATPGQVVATASVTNLTIGGVSLPLLGQLVPVITLRAVVASATATCTGATGTSQIEYLAVGGIPLISAQTAAAPNTLLNAGLAKVVLNEQIAAKGPGFGITVNAAHITVAGLLDVVIAGANANLLCPPVVTAVSPSSGPAAGGNLVTVTGANLAGAREVDFGPTKVTTGIVVNPSGTSLSVDAPPGTGTVDVQVVTPGGKSATSPADRYSYQPPPPTPYSQARLSLSPAHAGPDTPNFDHQALIATLTDRFAKPLPNMMIPFTVTGANPTTGTANTNAAGIATFTYTGAHPGTDTVKASFTAGNDTATSNPATVTWAAPGPISPISTSAVTGDFYAEAPTATGYTAKQGDTPAFTQTFPNIAFNPPAGLVPHDTSGVSPTTRPFTDITVDPLGDANGRDVAQGNGLQAGVGALSAFDADLQGSFQVSTAGTKTFTLYRNDGFILGVSNGATGTGNINVNPPLVRTRSV